MAAPLDEARVTSQTTTAGTSHTINVGSPAWGDLLIVWIRYGAASGTITFTGYTQLANDASDAGAGNSCVFYRWADGSEGVSDPMTTANSVKMAAICWEIEGAHRQSVPKISAVAVGTTTLNTCNPNSVAPAQAPQDTLYIAMGGQDGEVGAYTAAPTNYTNFQAANSSTGGLPATNVQIGGGSRQISASSSDDAGAFTHAAAAAGWTAFAVAIIPPTLESFSVLTPGRKVHPRNLV